jgi:hypothetical protein
MAVAQGYGKTVTSGSVFAYDTGDTRNSYRGEPTTNLKYAGDTELNDGIIWTNSGTWVYSNDDTSIDKPNLLGLNTQNLRIISGVTTSEGSQHIGCAYCTGLTPSTTYTISLWFRQSRAGSNQPYFRTNINNNSLGNFNYKGDTDATNWPTNQWIYITCTGTIQSNEDGIYLSNYIGSAVGDKVWYYGQQVEQKSHATPLALGTRSATQGLLPLVGNSTLDLSNVSFDSNAQMTFDGTNDYLDFTAPNLSGTATIEMVCKIGSGYSGKMIMGWLAYDIWCGSGHLGYNTANGDLYGISSSTVSSLGLVNNWKHYVFEMRSDVSYTNNKIYVNGTSQTLSQQLSAEYASNRNFNSGNGRIADWRLTGYYMPMDCNVFKVYNRALSAGEVRQNYLHYKTRFNLS